MGEFVRLPDYCRECTHFDEGKCCHPEPWDAIRCVLDGERCSSFEQNYDMEGVYDND